MPPPSSRDPWQAPPLRTPIPIAGLAYAQSPQEVASFPEANRDDSYLPRNYLTLEELKECFTDGLITHQEWMHEGKIYRLVEQASTGRGSRPLYLALDTNSTSSSRLLPSAQPRGLGGLGITPSFRRAGSSTSTSPTGLDMGVLGQVANGPAYTNGYANGGYANGYADPPFDENCFTETLVRANESSSALERFKLLVKLINMLRRHCQEYDPPLVASNADGTAAPSQWQTPGTRKALRQIHMVGESLARFGSNDFREGNNSSRAITAKDYEQLLRGFLQEFGACFQDEFVNALDPALQDDLIATRCLLMTRCEANNLIFNQLVRHVGLEGTGGQGSGAVVFNTSMLTTNSLNQCSANPLTITNALATSKAKLVQHGWGILGAVAAVGAVLLLGRGRIFGRRRRGGDDEDDSGSRRGGGGGGSGHWGGGSSVAPMAAEKQRAERLAVRYLMNCNAEVGKARHNIRLLENDWRLGPLRLAPPGQHHPPGYEHVRGEACSVDGFLQNLDRLSYGALPAAPDLYEQPQQPLMLPAPPLQQQQPAVQREQAQREQREPAAHQVAAAALPAAAMMGRLPEAAQHVGAAVCALMSAPSESQAPAAGSAGSS